ncbi:primosomal protein N' [Candidatus Falkowbacteria bacterium]|jgi:primosomal protein N' (replication factor Y) (superfamily II helicase)|nr:primosomal protein N' [Candidatus Falkowbacteria bacterium]MBT5502702.1 primosomal protein N' [Candidatus Falkowbacteria bacterium]MBT6573514.1 primosomal protein N' [Candidatus Falkowbacteria bacterium]MBT7348064.1 primosomal protein N' [Candidatus Falkowbacteria bacterium]MBT7501101.1 primosomal protein N' [Candidatus Falkowbacteria bacterium]
MQKVAQIIPHKKLPRSMHYFDYSIPKNLELVPGQIVNVPFKKSEMLGIVHSLKDKSEFKYIKEVISLEPKIKSLVPYQLEFINWFSQNYYYSKGSTLDLLLPHMPKRKVKVVDKKLEIPVSELKENQEVKDLAEKISKSKTRNFLLFPFDINLKRCLYLNLIQDIVAQERQILILFPQVYKVHEFYAHLSPELRKQTAVLTSDLYTSKARYFTAWQKIKSGESKIILGTRSAVFAPLSKLGTIILDDAHSDDYKQWDQNPRYETQKVVQKIQEITNCKLILSSLTPRVEDSYLAKEQDYKYISLGKKTASEIKIIDLKREREKSFTYLSDDLLNSIKIANKSLLIVNKLGEYSYFFCEDCGFEATCPECKLPLTVENNQLSCYRCGIKQSVYLNCPKCRSVKLKKLGIGLQQIKEQLRNVLGAEVCDLTQDENSSTAKILISTGQQIKTKHFQNLELLAFVYIDSLAYLADFNSNFKLYSFQQELIHRAVGAKVIVQTCFPENLAFQSLNQGYDYFYKQEIDSRKTFGYPPFATLIKLFFDHHDKTVCEREGSNFHKQINSLITQNKGKISEPYLHYRQKVRKRFRCQMAIFLPELDLSVENEILAQVTEHWTIDKSPIDLL